MDATLDRKEGLYHFWYMMHTCSMKRLHAVFFRLESGTEPVRDWLKSLGKDACARIGGDIKTVEYGWPVGMPVCRPLGDGLFEVRTHLPEGRIARVLFCVEEGRMFLLHGFIKKTQTTPHQDRQLALTRKKQLNG